MNGVLGHFCAHIGKNGPEEPSEDGEMYEMTLLSRQKIRNLCPGGLRPSTLPLSHVRRRLPTILHESVLSTC